jgi:hypothetical protein
MIGVDGRRVWTGSFRDRSAKRCPDGVTTRRDATVSKDIRSLAVRGSLTGVSKYAARLESRKPIESLCSCIGQPLCAQPHLKPHQLGGAPVGVNKLEVVTYRNAGKHLTPAERGQFATLTEDAATLLPN